MKHFRTITSTEMRNINRTAILDYIRSNGPVARTTIAEELDVSLPTVMRIVEELVNETFVIDTKERAWSGGRRRGLVNLNEKEHLTIGLDLIGDKFYGAVADLGGNILSEKMVERNNLTGEAAYQCLVTLTRQLLGEAQKLNRSLLGIGVGASGVTQHEKGIVNYSPSLDWHNFPLKERLITDFSLPVIVDRDVNLAALGEMWFGEGQEINDFVLINIGVGLGAGIILNRSLYRGANEAAGELGYLIPERSLLSQTFPSFGPLEMLVAGVGIETQVRKAIQSFNPVFDPDKNIEEYFLKEIYKESAWALELMETIADYMAITIASVCAFFDPQKIILGGAMARLIEMLIPMLQKRLEGHLQYPSIVVPSHMGQQATVKGAVISLFHNSADFYAIQKF